MIHDLGIIMLTAGVTSLVCKFLKQPVVLGYIVAGLLVGPYVCGASWVHENESVTTWGEVGVIFLLFSLGLEFSYKKLVQMGSTALIGCFSIVVGMMTAGFLLGRAMGWDQMNSLFLGGMLCMSSTTIVFKALDDLGQRQQKFANICFGILVVEDLFAVVLMVLLASLAVKQSFDGQEMFMQVVKLAAYLLFWFVAGIFVIPTLFKVCRHHLNDETLTIVGLGLCLGMVLLAEGAGFSAALGAFVMGSILAETVEAEKIEHLVSPIKNMFGAVFFVSVGMMIDPALLVSYWLPITLITVTVIVGQIIFATLGVVLSGQPLKTAMQSAFALTQVGEFAFIIANFGIEKGVTESFLYPVIVAVSVITTFLTPYTIRLAQPAYECLDKVLPRRWKLLLDEYGHRRNTTREDSVWKRLLKKVGLSVTLYTVTSIFIVTLYFSLINTWVVDAVGRLLPDDYLWVAHCASLLLILFVLSPLLYQILNKHKRCNEVREIMQGSMFSRTAIILLNVARLVLCIILVIMCISQLFDATYVVLCCVPVIVVLVLSYSPKVQRQSQLIERNFMANLTAREKSMRLASAQNGQHGSRRGSHSAQLAVETGLEGIDDMHFSNVQILPDSPVIGRTLVQLDLRNTTGVSVIRILRESGNINNPAANQSFKAGDRVVVSGSVESIELFRMLAEPAASDNKNS